MDTSVAAGATARALVGGPVDITTADLLVRRLLSVSRGGTVPLVADLTGVTQLASAGVRALYAGQRAAGGARPGADPGHRAGQRRAAWCSTWSGWTT